MSLKRLSRHQCMRASLWLLCAVAPFESLLAQGLSELTPVELRGVWYPKGERGSKECAQVQREGLGDLHSGALQITPTQMLDWKDMGRHTVVFVTEFRPRRRHVWRLQGLVDVYPYDAPKVLETFIVQLKKNELRWSKRSFDLVTERVNTQVYERCL